MHACIRPRRAYNYKVLASTRSVDRGPYDGGRTESHAPGPSGCPNAEPTYSETHDRLVRACPRQTRDGTLHLDIYRR
jgi:hypothetical protein